MPGSPQRLPPSIELVIFDCDGVLVDSERLACQGLVDLLRRYGIAADLAYVLEHFQGRSLASLMEHYHALDRPLPERFRDELRDWIAHAFRDALQPIAGIDQVLQSLHARALPYCVASSSDLQRVRLSLHLTGLDAHFDDRLYTAELVRQGKPAPDLFLYAAERMGIAPQHALVIEDSVSGVLAAKDAGMRVWGFVGGSHYLNRDGRALLRDAGADRIFDHMSQFWHS